MARPRSEEKQSALLDAAAKVVAESALFRYFATKAVLLNALYLHVKQSLGGVMRERLVEGASLEAQVDSLWDGRGGLEGASRPGRRGRRSGR